MSMSFVQPQLARAWVKRRDAHLMNMPGYTMEPKLDGHRCAIIRAANGVYLLSRRAKRIQSIAWLESWAEENLPPGTYIDGELISPALGDSSHNVHSLRANDPNALTYVAFDLLWDEGSPLVDMHWAKRRRALCTLTPMAFPWPLDGVLYPRRVYIIVSAQQSDTKPASARQATFDAWLAQGYEGAIFKDIFSPYRPNSRSSWIKWKWSMYTNVMVVSADAYPSEWRVRPGHYGTDGKRYPDGLHTDPWLAGWRGLEYGYGPAMHLPIHYTGNLKHVGDLGIFTVAGSLGVTGPPDEMAQYVGQVAKVKCWGVYESGALRHPQPVEYLDWDGRTVSPPEATYEST